MCDSHPKIIGAWAIDKHDLLGSWVNPRFAEPEKAEQQNMFFQAQIMISIAESNQKMYGRVKYILVSFENFDSFLFPLSAEVILATGCLKPYAFEEVINATAKVLKARF